MNVTITTSMKPVNEVKGLSVIETRHLKTKTELVIIIGGEKVLDIQGDAMQDIVLLGLEGAPLEEIVVTVEGIENFGRLFNRSIPALAKIGVTLSESPWDAKQGVVTFDMKDSTGNDFPMIAEVIGQLTERAKGSVSGTHHPLSLFDLKQAIGIVQSAKQGDEAAIELQDWFSVRELAILEEVKAAKKELKDEAKAKAKAEKPVAEKPKNASKPKAEKPVTKETLKTPPPPKSGKKASLIPETSSPN